MLILICRLSGVILFGYLAICAVLYGWGVGNMAGLVLGAFSGLFSLALAGDIIRNEP